MIKNTIQVMKTKHINYLREDGQKIKHKPWLGDLFSFLYDSIMTRSIFPKKFGASIKEHTRFLENECIDIHNRRVLELATGSGSITEVLPCDNTYRGIDISEGLLRIAYRKFLLQGFEDFELFVCDAEALPFEDDQFDLCICNLSLNFFNNLDRVVKELKRVIIPEGVFICSVPVPERNTKDSEIRGHLLSESELRTLFEQNGFSISSYDFVNGAILYFKGIKID